MIKVLKKTLSDLLIFILSISSIFVYWRSVVKIAHNGMGLCEVRATATESCKGNLTLAKTFSIF